MNRMTAEYQNEVSQFVSREVYYCASNLVSELVQKEEYMDELLEVCVTYDYEQAALDEGWEAFEDEFGASCYKHTDGQTWACSGWEELCQEFDIEPYPVEAFEHWLVSDWLADKLKERGEMVLRDFMGLTIWGRTAISLDEVICDIWDSIQ